MTKIQLNFCKSGHDQFIFKKEEQQKSSFWHDLVNEILTDTQLAICNMIIEGSTDQEIIERFGLKSKSNIGTCIRSTISGNIWSPNQIRGGSLIYRRCGKMLIY